jgi:hypothetical protein
MGSEHREPIANELDRPRGESLPKREALSLVESSQEPAAALNVLGDTSSAVPDGDETSDDGGAGRREEEE